MTLASSLSRFVESRIRERGREYFARGMVSLLSCGPAAVEAMVLGSEEYDVTLTREGGGLGWVPAYAGMTSPARAVAASS